MGTCQKWLDDTHQQDSRSGAIADCFCPGQRRSNAFFPGNFSPSVNLPYSARLGGNDGEKVVFQ